MLMASTAIQTTLLPTSIHLVTANGRAPPLTFLGRGGPPHLPIARHAPHHEPPPPPPRRNPAPGAYGQGQSSSAGGERSGGGGQRQRQRQRRRGGHHWCQWRCAAVRAMRCGAARSSVSERVMAACFDDESEGVKNISQLPCRAMVAAGTRWARARRGSCAAVSARRFYGWELLPCSKPFLSCYFGRLEMALPFFLYISVFS
jgi:hypothetical protein